MRVVSLAHNTPTGPPHHSYKILQKICLRVSKLWSAQGCVYNSCFRGDNYITNQVRVVSCMLHAYWSSSSSLLNIIKLSRTTWELWPAQDFGFSGDNYIIKTELSLLHATCLLVLLYIPTKYYRNISKGIKVMERTRMCLQFLLQGR